MSINNGVNNILNPASASKAVRKSIISGLKKKKAPVLGPQSAISQYEAPFCFTLNVKLFLYSPLGDSKPLGAIVECITLGPSQVLLSKGVKERGVRWRRV